MDAYLAHWDRGDSDLHRDEPARPGQKVSGMSHLVKARALKKHRKSRPLPNTLSGKG